jgi:hypothetical protein
MAVRVGSLLLHVLAAVLDFVFTFVASFILSLLLLFLLVHLFLSPPRYPPDLEPFRLLEAATLGGLPLVLIIAYFIVLGRTGGTIFQRLFRLKKRKTATDRQIVQQF